MKDSYTPNMRLLCSVGEPLSQEAFDQITGMMAGSNLQTAALAEALRIADERGSYAVQLTDAANNALTIMESLWLKDEGAAVRTTLWQALAKNPNPSGQFSTEASDRVDPEASGPVGLGPLEVAQIFGERLQPGDTVESICTRFHKKEWALRIAIEEAVASLGQGMVTGALGTLREALSELHQLRDAEPPLAWTFKRIREIANFPNHPGESMTVELMGRLEAIWHIANACTAEPMDEKLRAADIEPESLPASKEPELHHDEGCALLEGDHTRSCDCSYPRRMEAACKAWGENSPALGATCAVFAWWDTFNETFVRSPIEAGKLFQGGNKLIPLFVEIDMEALAQQHAKRASELHAVRDSESCLMCPHTHEKCAKQCAINQCYHFQGKRPVTNSLEEKR